MTVALLLLFALVAVAFLTLVSALALDDAAAWLALACAARLLRLRSLARRLVARCYGLGPPTHAFDVVPDAATARTVSGDVLRATVLLPRDAAGQQRRWPTVLLRTPYGRDDGEFGQTLLAERGFAVIIQDTRGRFGSKGQFVPVAHELDDGAATVAWAKRQSWCGELGVYGVSYLGFTAWACVGGANGGDVACAVIVASCSSVRAAVFSRDGAFALELVALWLALVLRLLPDLAALRSALQPKGGLARQLLTKPGDYASGARRAFCDYFASLSVLWWSRALLKRTPLRDLDVAVGGRRLAFVSDALNDPDEDGAFWREANVLCAVGSAKLPPTHLITGWHDIFARGAFEDWAAMEAQGGSHSLTVFDGAHFDLLKPRVARVAMKALLETMTKHLKADPAPSKGVRVQMASSALRGGLAVFSAAAWRKLFRPRRKAVDEWRTLNRWCVDRRLVALRLTPLRTLEWSGDFLEADFGDGGLTPKRSTKLWKRFPSASDIDDLPLWVDEDDAVEAQAFVSYIYSAADATPASGGCGFHFFNAGQRDQRTVERRGDVAVFSTAPLNAAFEMLGTGKLRVGIALDDLEVESIDVVARLCVVSRTGKSTNLAEGLTRLTRDGLAADRRANRVHDVVVHLSATGARLEAGERLRLQICSSAAPRWMHNPAKGFDGQTRNLTKICAQAAACPRDSVLVKIDTTRTVLVLPLFQ
ncbi:X-Pro dipeptidyl-peptidase-domain-containing protein [Pelagophyceae sp. CCMP2097]|nr:X-Pro dipeptidyl-peptidase-domain-containing protein [Pelagophyceae sp. CCMP2097]|mmetsp:Transcript_22661/g.78689  ORF Transcript_22661/g.78689 Transcript_22661/m.78689 type:complete len:705 (-) Transcript_22661:177-2291(-)